MIRAGRGVLAALAAAMPLGCAQLAPVPGADSAARESRPDAPAEYDVLVGQQHEIEGDLSKAMAAYERAASKDPDSSYLQRKLAELMARQNRLDAAVEHAVRAYELDPSDIPTRLFLGRVHRVLRDVPSSEKYLRSEDGTPLDDAAAFLLYQLYLENDRLPEALRSARFLLEGDPDSLRNRLAVATAHDQLEQPELAEQVLREGIEIAPDDIRIHNAIARMRHERGDREGEIEIYREILVVEPHDHTTLVSLSEAQMARDDLDGATATLEEVERHHPDDLQSIVRLGFLKYEARDYPAAAIRFNRVIAAHPDEYDVAFFLGVTLRRTGDDDGAVESFKRIPDDHEQYTDARSQIAAIHERNGDYPSALAEVERASKVDPSRELELYAATLRAKSGDLDGAVAFLEALIDEAPDDDELLYNLGVTYGEADRTDEALRYMDLTLEKNPNNASALNYVGYTWAEKGEKLDEAEEMIRRALELRPDDGYITDSLGWLFYMRARPLVESGRVGEARRFLDDALRQLDRADELTGGDPVISEHLGDTYLLMGRKRRALDKFEEAIRLEPRHGEQPDLATKTEDLRRELGVQ